uniref:Uncharacterized protein n=1 Tax=Romanomermis culicivorax TaxID=13658 RepID=A0A915J7A9_ROMCU
IFKICFASKKLELTKETCAKYCLPFLISNCIESSLNGRQFDSFMSLIKDMLHRVETEQRQRLQQFADSDEKIDSG